MEFSNLGKHCYICKQQDFLPFFCNYCKQHYCLEHRNHDCNIITKKKPKRFRYDGLTLIKKLRKIIVKIAIERNSNKLNGTRLFNFPKVTIKKNFG